MKKLSLVIGSIEIVIGLLSMMGANLFSQAIKKIVYAYTISNSNTIGYLESEFALNLGLANTIAVILCILGALTIGYFVFYKKE